MATMYLCDICGEKISDNPLVGIIPTLDLFPKCKYRTLTDYERKSWQIEDLELCDSCVNKIVTYIKMMKRKSNPKTFDD